MRHVLAASAVVLLICGRATGGTEQLALGSRIQYSRVIEGATDPILADIYNNAATGSDVGNYKLTAAYAPPHAASYTDFNYSYVDRKLADGGSGFATASFPLDTTGFDGGDVAVNVTLKDMETGNSITQGDKFTVLDRAMPGLFLQGQLVPLSSKKVITFDTLESPGAGKAAGGTAAGMQGRSPTSLLDLDSIHFSGSPAITSSLVPFLDLPSDSDPSEGRQFTLSINASPGAYNTSFVWHYSEEDDLPGADAPASQVAFFNVEILVAERSTHWTVTTDVPEPSSVVMFLMGCGLCLAHVLWEHLTATPTTQ